MRMNLAVLDWVCSKCITNYSLSVYTFIYKNENIQRAATSHRVYLNARRPDRQAPSRVLRPKTFKFVQNIWEAYVHINKQSTRYLDAYNEYCNFRFYLSPLLENEEVDEEADEEALILPSVGLQDGDFLSDDDDDDGMAVDDTLEEDVGQEIDVV